MPPLTPGTNQKMNAALLEILKGFDQYRKHLRIPQDPKNWSTDHTLLWINWATKELMGTDNLNVASLSQPGRNLLASGKEQFLHKAPSYIGDILWEHLELLEKESLVANHSSPEQYSCSEYRK